MRKIDYQEKHCLDSARGWLELGNPSEAKAEADKIPWLKRADPDVFVVHWRIYAWLGNWDGALNLARMFTKVAPNRPTGWLCLSYSLFKLKRPLEAFLHLSHQAKAFPQVGAISYFLGCCCLEMGDRKGAEQWLAKAKALGVGKETGPGLSDYTDLDSNRKYLPILSAFARIALSALADLTGVVRRSKQGACGLLRRLTCSGDDFADNPIRDAGVPCQRSVRAIQSRLATT